jgi:ribonuclease HI
MIANQFCISMCIRDANGGFLKAFTKTLEGQPEIREAEATVLLETLKWLQHYNMQRFHIETDCIQVVHGIEGTNKNNMEFGVIIENCKRLLSSFNNCKVSYVRRQANRIGHELAQAARLYASHQFFDYCPPCIENFIMNEIN